MSKIFKIPATHIRKSRFSKIAPLWVLGVLGNGCFLAGGSLRTLINDEEVCDFDLFFNGQLMYQPVDQDVFQPVLPARVIEVREILEKENFDLIFECPEGKLFTYKKGEMKVQLILETAGTPDEVINQFDINAGRCAFDGEFIYIPLQFARDVKTKYLSIHDVSFPVATMKRLVKYSNKGYNINRACKQFLENIQNKSFNLGDLRVYID